MAALLLPDHELLARLVAFDSTSSRSNLPIADFVCEYLHRPGVTVERNASPEGDRVNVVAVSGPWPDEAGCGLTLSGHLDAVPPGEEGWESDPFRLAEREDRYVGRGACDMKGSIALAMNAITSKDPARLRRPLALLLTYGEEQGALGAQHFCRTWPAARALPRSVVVGEPTSMRAVRMHKGHLTMRATVQGRPAHSGTPHLGESAIVPAARFVVAIARLAETLQTTRGAMSRFFPGVPYPVFNVGRIDGGSTVNVVPERCIVDLGVRLLPGTDSRAGVEWVRDAAARSDPQGRIGVEVVNDNPPLLLDESAGIHRALCGLLAQTGSCGVSFASDAGVLARHGYECVLFGPGSIEAAHRPNEHLPIDEFRRARPVLDRLVERLCEGE